ncbi:MAG: hypothetical protein FWD53_08375 [Phycisphaerales bacterium]|nr:hypothetical protein [Phycisphaerales bacterium]
MTTLTLQLTVGDTLPLGNVQMDPKPMELTLDNGRKYLLIAQIGTSYDSNHDKNRTYTSGTIRPGGTQTGKIGLLPHIPIALFDSNFDGFYTASEDGIVVGPQCDGQRQG